MRIEHIVILNLEIPTQGNFTVIFNNIVGEAEV